MTAQPDFPQAIGAPQPTVTTPAGSDATPPTKRLADDPIGVASGASLSTIVETFNDIQATRIAAENRARSLAQVYGWQEGDAPYDQAVAVAAALKALEHGVDLDMRRALRRHPLGPWVAAQHGIGSTQAARLLGSIGDPYWNDLYDRPRTVSELWAYCGYHVLPADHRSGDTQNNAVGREGKTGSHPDQPGIETQSHGVGVAAARRKGQHANWNPDAKMRVFLIAESCIKHRNSPYRIVYDEGREKYAESTHAAPCVRCGPKGKPAPVGSPLNKGHQHARAMRLVSKAILKNLWLEARRIHVDEAL